VKTSRGKKNSDVKVREEKRKPGTVMCCLQNKMNNMHATVKNKRSLNLLAKRKKFMEVNPS
jgi:hypothetical protein